MLVSSIYCAAAVRRRTIPGKSSYFPQRFFTFEVASFQTFATTILNPINTDSSLWRCRKTSGTRRRKSSRQTCELEFSDSFPHVFFMTIFFHKQSLPHATRPSMSLCAAWTVKGALTGEYSAFSFSGPSSACERGRQTCLRGGGGGPSRTVMASNWQGAEVCWMPVLWRLVLSHLN